MAEMVTIPKEEYDALMEELSILRDKRMMAQIRESEEALRKGVKPWKIYP